MIQKPENQLSLREIQQEEYHLLCKLVLFFEKHSIQYILCGGSMLGAVRHNGFIPWDDDIDILVPRDDYERLKHIYQHEDSDIDGMRLTIPGDVGSPHPFIKAYNPSFIVFDNKREEKYQAYLCVDVFPMDHFPDDEKEHRNCVNIISSLVRILSSNTISRDYMKNRGYYSNPVRIIKLFVSKALFHLLGGSSRISVLIDQYAKKMNEKYKSSNHVGDGAWPSGMKDYFPIEAVEPIMKHLFEDSEFNIPVNYDKYLTLFYGDYMTIPPEDKRQNHHITVYRVDS